jgi:hypothetical protein
VGGPPGVKLHTMVGGLPTDVVGETFPVVVMAIGVGMVPNGAAGVIAVGDIVVVDDVNVVVVPGPDVETALRTVDGGGTGTGVMEGDGRAGGAGGCGAGMVVRAKTLVDDVSGCWENVNGAIALPVAGVDEVAGTVGVIGGDGVIPAVPAIDDGEGAGTAGAPGVICPDGVEQITTVPGIAGSEARGSGANVVSGVPGWVVAENGLGPLSGDVTIVPGVDESPMAVVPMVETCARLALQPNSRAAANKRRIVNASSAPI